MEEQPKKICVICGKDCSKQKRVKDDKGRYYHKECIARAREAQKKESSPAGGEFLGSAAVIAPPSEDEREGEYDMSDSYGGVPAPAPDTGRTEIEPLDDVDQYIIEDDEEPASPGPNTALVTTFEPDTPAQSTRIAPVPTRYAGEGGKYWPPVVGVLSILIGLAEGIYVGLDPVGGLIGGKFSLFPLIVAGVAVVLSLWLLAAGIGILVRNQSAMSLMQKWAKLKILYSIAIIGGVVAMALLKLKLLGEFDVAWIESAEDSTVTSLVVNAAARLVLLVIWPAVMLLWFSRDRVQKDIGFWH